MKIDHTQLEKHLKKGYETKDKPLFIWGTTGIGKSETTRKVAEQMAEKENRKFKQWNKLSKDEKHNVVEDIDNYFLFFDLRASQFDPSDLRGLPSLNSHETVEWKIPFWLYAITQKECKAMVFLDELNLAPPSVFSAFYQLINDRALGEVSIGKDVYMVSAGNRLKDKANVNPLPAPLKNRFLHLELTVPNKSGWINWAMENDIDSRVISFIRLQPDLLFKFNPEGEDKAFPTPRTWEYTSDLIREEKDIDFITNLVASAVGQATANQFRGFIKLRDEINLEDYLERPAKVKDLSSPDLKHSLISLTVEKWKEKQTQKLFKKILNLTGYLEDEFGVLLLRLIKKVDPEELKEKAKKVDKWEQISQRYSEYLID